MSETESPEDISKKSEKNRAENKSEPAGLSRQPEDYVPSDHFLTRFSPACGRPDDTRLEPQISSDVVETCIKHGTVRRANGKGRWILEAEVDDFNWWLVVGLHEGQTNDVLTAYVPGRHEPDLGGEH